MGGTGSGHSGAEVTVDDLERERLRTYIDWAEVRAPRWYWPTYATVIAAWIAGYELGMLWGTAGAGVAVIVLLAMVRAVTRRSGVSTPRFRSMPARLQRAFHPFAVTFAVSVAGVMALTLSLDRPPFLLLGPVAGVAMSLAGAWASQRYREAATQLAEEAGMVR